MHVLMSTVIFSNPDLLIYDQHDPATIFGYMNVKVESIFQDLYQIDIHDMLTNYNSDIVDEYFHLTNGHVVFYLLGISFILGIAIL